MCSERRNEVRAQAWRGTDAGCGVVARYFSWGGGEWDRVIEQISFEHDVQVCIPYIDPALMQTRQQVFQITYGFTCTCSFCTFLHKIGQIPEPPVDHSELVQLGLKLREFVGVEDYLKTGKSQAKPLEDLPRSLRSVLNESYMSELSETFSKASHEGDYGKAADSGVTLLALYLLVYPKNYTQIGMIKGSWRSKKY